MAPQSKEDRALQDLLAEQSLQTQSGRKLAEPEAGDEIVISGISGQYPESRNVYEFRDNLFNKVDMVSDDNRRWEPGHPEIPHRTGKIPEIDGFDASYFGVHQRQATTLDPMIRKLLEIITETLFDAGLHPSDLENTNTGVYVGACFSETEKTWFTDNLRSQNFAITGCDRVMLANRISYFYKLKGPSMTCDTACSSSLYTLEHAYKDIRSGKCDQAIVAGSNLCLNPFVSLQFARLGVLSLDGSCKAFDTSGNGYARSETISAILLQKGKDANRVYAMVLHVKTNCDGYKDTGITFPSRQMQVKLLKEFYTECTSVKPSELSFLEAHGTGTKVGDPEELLAVEEIFLKDRNAPLMVGSVKSNLGHTEPSSGLCSITKCIVAFETGYIPPNLHFKIPREGIRSLEDGTLRVVTEKTPFADNRGLIAISSFGFGGGNCHVLLKRHAKKKLNRGRPQDEIPRLVCVSGRTEEAVNVLLDDVIQNGLDVEQIRLLQNSFRKDIRLHNFRGFTLADKCGEIFRSCSYFKSNPAKLIVCFGVISETIRKQVQDFVEIPSFSGTIQKVHEVLINKSLNIMNILLENAPKSVLDLVLANITFQLAIADLFKALEIKPNKIFGVNQDYSLGILVCAYFDGALTLKETIELAFVVGTVACKACKNGSRNLVDLLQEPGNIGKELQAALVKIIPKPRKLSKNVIFDAVPAQIDSSYLSQSFGVLSVLDKVKNISKSGYVILDVGNGEVTKPLNNKNHKTACTIKTEGVSEFLSALGRLYELGLNPQLQFLYPKVQFPVSLGTPMISPAIRWKHDRQWHISLHSYTIRREIQEKSFRVCIQDTDYTYISGHIIDGRNLYPATGYLYCVWETFADIQRLLIDDMKVVFENCRFVRACTMPSNIQAKLELNLTIQRGSGNFEVTEGGMTVVTGRIREAEDEDVEVTRVPLFVPNTDVPSMSNKDVYKELRLRGYNYKGLFRSIQSCDRTGQVGKISWHGNWVAFMDNMLQMKILQEDTRLLYVPTTITRLSIDARKHIEYSQQYGENPILPVYSDRHSGIIQSGGIEIRGLIASSIARRKGTAFPVLEKHVFVPNNSMLTLEQALRVNTQILLENYHTIQVKVVEVIDESTPQNNKTIGDILFEVLGDQPLIQPSITVLSKTNLEVSHVTVEDRRLLTEVDCHLVVASKLSERSNVLNVALGSLQGSGFILSREALDFNNEASFKSTDLSVLTTFNTGEETLVFLRKSTAYKSPMVLKISSSDTDFSWLPKLRHSLDKEDSILLYAQGEEINGTMGFLNCIRREPGGQKVRLVFLADPAPSFDLKVPFYDNQVKKQMALNVFKDGQWGSYRHLQFDQNTTVQRQHFFLNSLIRGDLKTLKWIEGPLNTDRGGKLRCGDTIVDVCYAALNFRDVMTATGKINVDTITRDRRHQECVQGFEFSGLTKSGKRVMGTIIGGAIASQIVSQERFLVDVPDGWSLKDGATVMCVYTTTIFGLIAKARIKAGDSVLIHSGTGGVGQAAITVALANNCTVYTTVGTQEKRDFLKKLFPQMTDKHIFNSRDISFEKGIMEATNGKGVDVVLNSLAEEKQLASVRCLAHGGTFLEIGKFDMGVNNSLSLQLLEKECSFHGIMLDILFQQDNHVFSEVVKIMVAYLNRGIIRPLNSTVFSMDQVEEAFRYMGTGKHIGKVLIQIREEQDIRTQSSAHLYPCLPRFWCNSEKTYIICGGLGGFGLELADWLVMRGCRRLVLTSRTGVKTGYQAYRIAIWKSYGCLVQIATDDITTETGCDNLIRNSNKLGPVHSIFNLAVVLQDAIFPNQSEEMFKISLAPKATAAIYLDAVTRKYCPDLRDFVMFSSVSCGRGNGGQTNYGMANSIMERICEKRRREGFPGLAIQWGAIGEVGLVADMQEEAIEIEIGGTLQQKISSCIEVLDMFLSQSESAVVASTVVAEKRGMGTADNIVNTVAVILGIKDLKTISFTATLAEVGMDSMTAVEIKQTLEREFEVFLTPQDIKAMTFARLKEIQDEKEIEKSENKTERPLTGYDIIFGHLLKQDYAESPVLNIKGHSSDRSAHGENALIFPGIDGLAVTLEPLYERLEGEAISFQYCSNDQTDTIESMAEQCLQNAEGKLSRSVPFRIISHSFGGAVALQFAKELEDRGHKGTVILIDSSPDYLKSLTQMLEVESEDKLQMSLLARMMSINLPIETVSKHMVSVAEVPTFMERLVLADKIVRVETEIPKSMIDFTMSVYKRLKALLVWSPDFVLESRLVLFKPKLNSIQLKDADYGLSRFCKQEVLVKEFDGNHVTVLENLDLAKDINDIFWKENDTVTEKESPLIVIDKPDKQVLTKS